MSVSVTGYRKLVRPAAALLSVILSAQSCNLFASERVHRTGNDGKVSPDPLSSRLGLLFRLVHEEGLVQRITHSDDDEARRVLGEARFMWEQAETSYEAGDSETASGYINKGLASVSLASRMVADTARRSAEEKTRYDSLRKRVLGFTEAFQRVVVEKPEEDIAGLLDMDRVSDLLRDAEGSAVEGDYRQAVAQAKVAAEIVEKALARAREHDTLLHELDFATPREAYDYEQQRNRSYRLLADMLDREGVHDPSRLGQLRAAVNENNRLREHAARIAEHGDLGAAISLLEQGTEELARVLRMTGLVF